MKQIRRSKGTHSSAVDGKSSSINIADLFSNKYNELYISVAFNENDFEDLRKVICKSGSIDNAVVIAPDVLMAINKLKPDKSDDKILRSNHFKSAGHVFSV